MKVMMCPNEFKWLLVTRMEALMKQKSEKPDEKSTSIVNSRRVLLGAESKKGQKTCCKSLKLIRRLLHSYYPIISDELEFARVFIYIWIVNNIQRVKKKKLMGKRAWKISAQSLFIFGIDSHSKCLIYCVVICRLIMSWGTSTSAIKWNEF